MDWQTVKINHPRPILPASTLEMHYSEHGRSAIRCLHAKKHTLSTIVRPGSTSAFLVCITDSRMATAAMHHREWDMAFGIYVCSGLDMDAALKFCSMTGVTNDSYCQEVIEQRYLLENIQQINQIHEGGPAWEILTPRIKTWLVEYSLHNWIQELNRTAGVAPSYETVFAENLRLRFSHDLCTAAYVSYDNRKIWVRRFMSKWKSKRLLIDAHEAESAAEVVRKARAQPEPNFQKCVAVATPFLDRMQTPKKKT